MNPRYPLVVSRAGHRCEYCRAPEAIFNLAFEVEHIVPRSKNGGDHASNWASSCRSCNLHKPDHTEGVDELAGEIVRLFHPRRDHWGDHFRVDPESGAIVELTAIGRATAAKLEMNRPSQLAARQQWMRLRVFPR